MRASRLRSLLSWLKIDSFLLSLLAMIVLASLWPAQGEAKVWLHDITIAAIALLFFLHGAKLSSRALLEGLTHWRLHLLIFASTFILFPLLALLLGLLPESLLSHQNYQGFLYLAILPATVQSAIAFTSIARGNVAAAICSASGSSLLGVVISPVLVALLIHIDGDFAMQNAIVAILLQLMLPFVCGHLSRPWVLSQLQRHPKVINGADRLSILLVVYAAFSEAVVEGIWTQVSGFDLTIMTLISCLFLAIVLFINLKISRYFGFNTQDEIVILFCGSKKSLANGLPMANILFPAAQVGMMVLPLMIFHQIQLMICAAIARHYAERTSS